MLYDNAGHVIWQGGPPLLWSGNWAQNYGNLAVPVDPNKYSAVMLEYNKPIIEAITNFASHSYDLDNGRPILPLGLLTSDNSLGLQVAGQSGYIWFNVKPDFRITVTTNTGGLILTAIYGIEK
jgi:hypothetical protein